MSDHYQDIDTRADAAAEAALDALLIGHQADLHSALASALDIRTGLAQLGREPKRQWRRLAENIQTTHVVHVAEVPAPDIEMWVVHTTRSSTLASAVDAVEKEVLQVEAFIDELEEHPNREVTPPGAGANPLAALWLVCRELNRITDLLADQRITKESAGSEFDVVQETLEDQVTGWTEKLSKPSHSEQDADMLDGFLDRANAAMRLRKLIVRLFEDADENVLQLN